MTPKANKNPKMDVIDAEMCTFDPMSHTKISTTPEFFINIHSTLLSKIVLNCSKLRQVKALDNQKWQSGTPGLVLLVVCATIFVLFFIQTLVTNQTYSPKQETTNRSKVSLFLFFIALWHVHFQF